jgi:hypothetical protein
MVAGALCVVAGCGARTPVDELGTEVGVVVDGGGLGRDGGGALDATVDATMDVDVAIADAPAWVDGGPDASACGGCDDGVACTRDRCEADTRPDGAPPRGCIHEPDDSLCPPGLTCGIEGCAPIAYTCNGDGTLAEVNLQNGSIRVIGSDGDAGPASGLLATLTDIGLHPNGTLYGIDVEGNVSSVDRGTGEVTALASTNIVNANGLTVAPDGTLYASVLNQLYRVDLTLFQQTVVATLPSGYFSSGDLVFDNGVLFLAARLGDAPASDTLMAVSLTDRTARVVGEFGFPCVWGLASRGQQLFGFTCAGNFFSSDPASGAGTKSADLTPISFSGAASR